MATSRNPKAFSNRLRRAIKDSGRTGYSLAKESGVSEPAVSRFMNRHGELNMANSELIARELGLSIELVTVKRRKR